MIWKIGHELDWICRVYFVDSYSIQYAFFLLSTVKIFLFVLSVQKFVHDVPSYCSLSSSYLASLIFLKLWFDVSHQIWEIFCHYFSSKCCSISLLWDSSLPYIILLNVHISPGLCHFFFNLFSLSFIDFVLFHFKFTDSCMVYELLLIPINEYLISYIVLFS